MSRADLIGSLVIVVVCLVVVTLFGGEPTQSSHRESKQQAETRMAKQEIAQIYRSINR
jgi:hypothetical protein